MIDTEVAINEEGTAKPEKGIKRSRTRKQAQRTSWKQVNGSGMGQRLREGGGERTGRKKPKALKQDDLASSSSRKNAAKKASARRATRKKISRRT